MKIPFKVGLEEAMAQLPLEDIQRFTVVMKHGTMSVEYYAPRFKDLQTPHPQDELYIIAAGKALFIREEKKITCRAGDVLFVPAGTMHKFENFSDDFATWVIFYGPESGEG
ncbi:MAG: cupin domain-containing protein [Chitinophagaceae bacterium]|nr:cupin domain-containing protein [Chitinophagaceae bacterium]